MSILLISATRLEHYDEDIDNIPIHIIKVGKVNAAINTYRLIQKYHPSLVINFGSCGNLKGYKTGEVLEVGQIYDDFYDYMMPEHPPIKISESPIKLFTTDHFYNTNLIYSSVYQDKINKCDIVDMEGYSIAQVCSEEKVPVIVYKWISDDGDSSTWEAHATKGYQNFKQILKTRIGTSVGTRVGTKLETKTD
jgi:adenosylhomocysteine nucleosidase